MKPDDNLEERAFDSFMGTCIIPLLCKWCGGIDDEMADDVPEETMKTIRDIYEANCNTKEDKDFLLEIGDYMDKLKDAIREAIIKTNEETELEEEN